MFSVLNILYKGLLRKCSANLVGRVHVLQLSCPCVFSMNKQLCRSSVVVIVGLKCSLAASHAAPW